MNTDLLKKLLVIHEGLRTKPYQDSKGIATIGVGHNMEARPLPDDLAVKVDAGEALTYAECMQILDSDIEIVVDELNKCSWFSELSDVRKTCLCDMVFNLGFTRFLGFKHLNLALENGDYVQASEEMLHSLWASQVGERAQMLALMMRHDEEPTD